VSHPRPILVLTNEREETALSIDYGNVTASRAGDAPNYGRNADGYGRKIPTRWEVQLDGERRWRRVYCVIYSNSGSLYCVKGGANLYLHDTDIEAAQVA
jgi:hypothetical protein